VIDDDLSCPRDAARLELRGDVLACPQGHQYPQVDGISVLVLDDLAPNQPGYWATAEDIARARLEADVEGEDVGDGVDPYVAKLIIGTCGNLYRHAAPRLRNYPIPPFPLDPPREGARLLDIGCNWGRWSIAAARAGYRVVGIDPSLEAVRAARRISRRLGVEIDYLVADARALPFSEGSFDVVFSYSVLQHLPKPDAARAVHEVGRVLASEGSCLIQMPNAYGLRNFALRARRLFREAEGFEVRYWTSRELRQVFAEIGETSLSVDGFFSLNAQATDLELFDRRHRAIVRTSAALKRASRQMPLLTGIADSVYVRSTRRTFDA
jgi:2-polyprenyl-3-methyl-5-hydroxy-6-metoxy-1,4-benzoquinol methylase